MKPQVFRTPMTGMTHMWTEGPASSINNDGLTQVFFTYPLDFAYEFSRLVDSSFIINFFEFEDERKIIANRMCFASKQATAVCVRSRINFIRGYFLDATFDPVNAHFCLFSTIRAS